MKARAAMLVRIRHQTEEEDYSLQVVELGAPHRQQVVMIVQVVELEASQLQTEEDC
jgi:hypothetical protein